jgi:hypothetical protein
VLVVLAIVLPIVLSRLRKSPVPAQQNEEVTR